MSKTTLKPHTHGCANAESSVTPPLSKSRPHKHVHSRSREAESDQVHENVHRLTGIRQEEEEGSKEKSEWVRRRDEGEQEAPVRGEEREQELKKE